VPLAPDEEGAIRQVESLLTPDMKDDIAFIAGIKAASAYRPLNCGERSKLMSMVSAIRERQKL